MYKVETDNGIYAVKELNSGVIKREKTYSNLYIYQLIQKLQRKIHTQAQQLKQIMREVK